MGQFSEKIIISIVGSTNVGKSTLFNLITGQKNRAIVDSKAGTTADNVKSLMEIHGLGRVKLVDTAGIDEDGILGAKKKEKTKEAIGESDLVIFVISNITNVLNGDEIEILNYIKSKNKKMIVIYNQFTTDKNQLVINDYEYIEINATSQKEYGKLIEFIKENCILENKPIDLLPKIPLANTYVLLVIPLDEESPELRLLRPQSMMIERLLNVFAIPVLYRPNLKDFDGKDFVRTIDDLQNSTKGLSLIITDSQTISKLYDFIPKDINFTSFSMIMSNYMTNGRLNKLIEGANKLDSLKDGDRILIVEACNHDRKCNDIATVQLPNAIKKYTEKDIQIDFNFGQSFFTDEELGEKGYRLAILCGGCMIDRQKYQNRLEMLESNNVPISNYGVVFSYIKDKKILKKTMSIMFDNK